MCKYIHIYIYSYTPMQTSVGIISFWNIDYCASWLQDEEGVHSFTITELGFEQGTKYVTGNKIVVYTLRRKICFPAASHLKDPPPKKSYGRTFLLQLSELSGAWIGVNDGGWSLTSERIPAWINKSILLFSELDSAPVEIPGFQVRTEFSVPSLSSK